MSSISVAVPTAGRPDYLRASLQSILAQTLPPDEIVVSEDGADPRTAEVVEEAARAGIPLRLYRNVPPLLQRGNRQQAFELTHGDYVAMLDDDDEWEPEFLERVAAVFDAHPECGFVSADHWVIDETGARLRRGTEEASKRFGRSSMAAGVYSDVLLRHLREKPFALGATLFRRSALEAVGFFPEHSGTACDYGLFVELGVARAKAYYLPERLGRYRVHDGQITHDRVLPGLDVTRVLEEIHQGGHLDREERELAASRYRLQVVEVAVGYGHRRDVGNAFRTLRRYPTLGWGKPSLGRLGVLALLLLGAKPSWRHVLRRRR